MLKYYNELVRDDVVYSIDMVRIRLDFSSEERIQAFGDWCCRIENLHIESYPLSTKAFSYRYLFKITCGNGSSFVCGLGFNGTTKDSFYLGFLEFNPNKVAREKEFVEFMTVLGVHCFRTDISRYDLAIDVPISRACCCLIKDERKYSLVRNSAEDTTEYLGCRNKSGFSKLYNKQKESDLNDDLTRLEITVDWELSYSDFCGIVPNVEVADYQYSFVVDDSLNSTDRVICDLIRRVPLAEQSYYLNRLAKVKRRKLKPFIFPCSVSKKKFEVPKDVFLQLKKQLRKFDLCTKYTLIDDIKDYG